MESWIKTSVKRAKTLARLPREQSHTTGKELILLSTPPQKGKEVVMVHNPFSTLAEGLPGGADNLMIDLQEEEQMEEDEVEEYIPLSQLIKP